MKLTKNQLSKLEKANHVILEKKVIRDISEDRTIMNVIFTLNDTNFPKAPKFEMGIKELREYIKDYL